MNRRLLPHWHRKLTHGYCAWGVYLSIVLNFAADHVDAMADYFSWWMTPLVLVAALGASLIKQESVSG